MTEGAAPTDRRGAGIGQLASSFGQLDGGPFGTIVADPPWRFAHRTGKVSPEYRRHARYATMTTAAIAALPVGHAVADDAHLYLWVPNALLVDGLAVMQGWGFTYKANLVWHKVLGDGRSDRRGVGFYFRNVTELVLFGVRGSLRTLHPGRRQVNLFASRKREHSRKPEQLYDIVEACSPGPYLELFARHPRLGWAAWGDEADSPVPGPPVPVTGPPVPGPPDPGSPDPGPPVPVTGPVVEGARP